MSSNKQSWVGQAFPRTEDAALLTGNARYIDDLSPVPGIKHVSFLRSPYPHARIIDIDVSAALKLPGVYKVLTGDDISKITDPLVSAIRAPVTYYPIAAEKVRYVGEPVAIIVADDRYLGEDAAEIIDVRYEELPSVTDPLEALNDGAPVLHERVGSNLLHDRNFVYGDPDTAFEKADRIIQIDWRYPKQSATPMETFGVIAHFEQQPNRYTVWSNFQGPYILHPIMARSLRVSGNFLRLISAPFSGGSFGLKQAIYPYIVLLAAASRISGFPLKWTEDRLEHLMASSSSADRADELEAAFAKDGSLMGLRFKNCVNVGAYVRAPEPASVYRMHAASNGCYSVKNISINNKLVSTNKVPIGLNRGYGGPQFYYGLERIMDLAARKLDIDPAEIRRKNFIPAGQFPYHAPAGAVYDSGNYSEALDLLLKLSDYENIKLRREQARAAGRFFGIGIGVGVEPSGSNMAYVTLAQTAEERNRAGGRSGGTAVSNVTIDPTGAVSVNLDSTPAGQGHETVAAQVVADILGLSPNKIDVNTSLDTGMGGWSLASGNYSNRFSSIVITSLTRSAERIAVKLRKIAGNILEVAVDDVELADGGARIVGIPDSAIPIERVAAAAHWDPVSIPTELEPGLNDTAFFNPDVLASPDNKDRVASALTFGYIFDLAAVEIDIATGRVIVDCYASVHDVGRVLNPIIVEGQIRGGFAHGFGAAMFEALHYDDNGNFLSGSFADYLCPTATDLPQIKFSHYRTDTPTNPLGSKGMGDGSSMLTPVVMANAVADALGREKIDLPLTLNKVWELAKESKN
ncbi:MAG: xanthine dehydrogenase family protein molybdopterin-binding subunit [Pseudomonadota bacterium]|jgi:2-furoyl-CoA dehydrogenase large subunit|nr:xanthine dehydrogenase family protein molybdopterin-binding subunit [Pseudomonadota bacterium]